MLVIFIFRIFSTICDTKGYYDAKVGIKKNWSVAFALQSLIEYSSNIRAQCRFQQASIADFVAIHTKFRAYHFESGKFICNFRIKL